MTMASTRLLGMALIAVLSITACGDSAVDDRPLVVATTSILGDITAELAGDAVEVVVLLPIGADPHDYAPSASDAARLRDADLVIANGLHLEEGLADALDSAIADGVQVVVIGDTLDPVLLPSGDPDPHVWLDPVRMEGAVDRIAAALADIAGVDAWEAATDYNERLAAAHAEAGDILAAIPAERRLLVAGHDALRHFADRYGFTVVGVVVPGGSTAATPGAQSLGELADEMRRLGIDDVFTEAGDPIDVVDALAAEAGAAVHPLYVGSLGPEGSGAETYLGLLVTNARLVATAIVGS